MYTVVHLYTCVGGVKQGPDVSISFSEIRKVVEKVDWLIEHKSDNWLIEKAKKGGLACGWAEEELGSFKLYNSILDHPPPPPLTFLAFHHSINQTINWSINQTINGPINQPNNQLISQQNNQRTNQPINQSINHLKTKH